MESLIKVPVELSGTQIEGKGVIEAIVQESKNKFEMEITVTSSHNYKTNENLINYSLYIKLTLQNIKTLINTHVLKNVKDKIIQSIILD